MFFNVVSCVGCTLILSQNPLNYELPLFDCVMLVALHVSAKVLCKTLPVFLDTRVFLLQADRFPSF